MPAHMKRSRFECPRCRIFSTNKLDNMCRHLDRTIPCGVKGDNRVILPEDTRVYNPRDTKHTDAASKEARHCTGAGALSQSKPAQATSAAQATARCRAAAQKQAKKVATLSEDTSNAVGDSGLAVPSATLTGSTKCSKKSIPASAVDSSCQSRPKQVSYFAQEDVSHIPDEQWHEALHEAATDPQSAIRYLAGLVNFAGAHENMTVYVPKDPSQPTRVLQQVQRGAVLRWETMDRLLACERLIKARVANMLAWASNNRKYKAVVTRLHDLYMTPHSAHPTDEECAEFGQEAAGHGELVLTIRTKMKPPLLIDVAATSATTVAAATAVAPVTQAGMLPLAVEASPNLALACVRQPAMGARYESPSYSAVPTRSQEQNSSEADWAAYTALIEEALNQPPRPWDSDTEGDDANG